MSSDQESKTQDLLDDAIRSLYSDRPAKVATLLGLVNEPTGEVAKLAFSTGPIPGTEDRLPNTSVFNPLNPKKVGPGISRSQGDNTESQNSLTSNYSGTQNMPDDSFLAKRAMTEQDLMAYYGTGADLMGGSGMEDGSVISPKALLGVGGSAAALATANRLSTTNRAKRELKKIRAKYLASVAEGGKLSSKELKLLNKELALRGASPSLRKAHTVGIADALMSKAEKDLSKKFRKARYKGALPLLATSLLGATAYNKLSE